jgi:hypothetical protein
MRSVGTRRAAGWLSRNERQMLLASLAFVLVLLLCGLLGSRFSDDVARTQASRDNASHDPIGSILFVPANGDGCRQRFLDNQTGRSWDSGTVPCDQFAPDSLHAQPGRYSSGARVDAIRKGFVGRAEK